MGHTLVTRHCVNYYIPRIGIIFREFYTITMERTPPFESLWTRLLRFAEAREKFREILSRSMFSRVDELYTIAHSDILEGLPDDNIYISLVSIYPRVFLNYGPALILISSRSSLLFSCNTIHRVLAITPNYETWHEDFEWFSNEFEIYERFANGVPTNTGKQPILNFFASNTVRNFAKLRTKKDHS